MSLGQRPDDIRFPSPHEIGEAAGADRIPRPVVFLHDGTLLMRGVLSALESASRFYRVTATQVAAEVHAVLQETCELPVLLVGLPQVIDDRLMTDLRGWTQRSLVLGIARMLDRGQLNALVGAGLHGCLDMTADAGTLIAALGIVARDRFFLSGPVGGELFVVPDDPPPLPVALPNSLTQREGQVLTLVAEGWTHKQISSQLGLSKATIDTYVQRIRQKLSVHNKADLTRAAVQYGLGPVEISSTPARMP
ncbi:helix-turn-helix transcriptional regulator [Actinomadura opuntiae]|uniref:helix-turn-helix transcriptional regulator n=1 Tax=Actinomadura sp. OS1-43 TaxID=604315 RepID=UPI00255B3599|nr:response regulator transcription factor [Actinomadura sp. OS1-43]MDL4817182.1 response regulator transcription factor [Actinomadura sp. OS1-43]